MKILHTIYRLSEGGAESQLRHLVNNSKNNQHAIFCVDDSAKNKIRDKIKIYTFKRKYKLDFFSIFRALKNAISDFSPDIIHSWRPHYTIFPTLILGKIFSKKIIASFRSIRFFRSIKDIIEFFLIFFFADYIVSNVDITLNTKPFQWLFKIKRGKIIPNGFPIQKIKEAAKKSIKRGLNNNFNLLFVGRLVKVKDIPVLINAMSKIKNENIHLTILGKGKQEEEICKSINKLKLDNKISMLGYQENVYPIIKNSDLLILPSIYEGMPNVIFESMTLKTPVLVSDIPQHQKWIKDEANGFLFTQGDCTSLYQTIIKIYENKKTYHKVRKRAQKFVQKFDIKKTVQKYNNFYSNL